MRVLYVSTRSDVVGGSNVHIRDVALAMMKLGHEVRVLGGQDGAYADDLRANGVPYAPLYHLVRDVNPYRDVRAVSEIRRHLRNFAPDILSLHTAKAGTVGRLAAWGTGIPVVYTPHGWTFTTGVPKGPATVYSAIERALAPLADAIVNVCEFERTLALNRRVGRAAQHHTIHNGMPDTATLAAAPKESGTARLVMVARFEEPKDHRTLIRALEDCLDLEWSLDLIGSGPLQQEVEAMVDAAGLKERVSILGPRDDVATLLATYHLFVLTSRWEGFPRSILEAMRAGLPVLASGVGGVHEAVLEGRNGYVLTVGDHETTVQHLRALISNPELRGSMGKEGRKLFEQRFTFERMFGETLALYEELLERDV